MWLIYGELFHTRSSVERHITACFLHSIWSNAYWKKYDSSLEKIIGVTEKEMLTRRVFLLKYSERIVCAVWKGHHQNLHILLFLVVIVLHSCRFLQSHLSSVHENLLPKFNQTSKDKVCLQSCSYLAIFLSILRIGIPKTLSNFFFHGDWKNKR